MAALSVKPSPEKGANLMLRKCKCGQRAFYRGICTECIDKLLSRSEQLEKENAKLLTDIQKIEVNTDYWADRGRLLETLIREQLQAMDNTPMADINHAGMEWHRRAKELIQGPPVSVRSTITAKLGVNYCPIECNDDCFNPDNVQCCRACPKLAECPEPCDELNRIERRGKAGENPTETGKG